jgi:hypothetical protein
MAFVRAERSDCRMCNEPEEIADLEGYHDQCDGLHHRPNVITTLNSNTGESYYRQSSGRKKSYEIEA